LEKDSIPSVYILIHSLLLNADVPAYRLRTYGGLVQAADGARSGGHAWTAYQRESDNEWVVIDFSFFPETLPTSARNRMKDDETYPDVGEELIIY
jgi:hypothetical protein